jgi:hypothetical protein
LKKLRKPERSHTLSGRNSSAQDPIYKSNKQNKIN